MAIVKKAGVPAKTAKAGSQTPSWAKRGAAAKQEMEKYEEDATKHWEAKNRMWRFWIPKGESAQVTFTDGDLLPDGTLDILTFREHTVKVNGEWENFVCIAESEPCPICEEGDFPSLVGVLTCLDHRTYKGKKGVYKDTQKLYAIQERETASNLGDLKVDVGEIKTDVGWLRAYLDVSQPAPRKNGKRP